MGRGANQEIYKTPIYLQKVTLDFTSEGFEIHIENKGERNMGVTMLISQEINQTPEPIPEEATIAENNEFLEQEMSSLFMGATKEVTKASEMPKSPKSFDKMRNKVFAECEHLFM